MTISKTTPISTYRLQFNAGFTFRDAEAIVPYLKDLGVSHIYASPIFKARPGSAHGYDITDPNLLNPELGTDEDFIRLTDLVREKGMAWIQDIVPNHMVFDSSNAWLMDILESRTKSPYYRFFDINWHHPFESFQGRILTPFLGNLYSEALENGDIRLKLTENGLSVRYFDHAFPLALDTYHFVLMRYIQDLEKRLGPNHPDVIKYIGIVDMFTQIARREESHRGRQIAHVKHLLWDCYSSNEAIRDFIDEKIALYNGQKGDPDSFQLLDELLAEQCFRLSFWKVASEELNYRRFFAINDLISVRVEDPKVFTATHALITSLVKEGRIQGVRVDHIDGLYDPAAYLERLRSELGDAYIIVEKILTGDEALPAWPIQGTTGYDFMNQLNSVYVDPASHKKFLRLYYTFSGFQDSYEKVVADKKRLIIGKHMAGDIDNLAYLMKRVAGKDRFGRDITLYGLKRALVEVVTFFPVYRTYLRPGSFDSRDTDLIESVLEKAREKAPGLSYELTFIEDFLLGRMIQRLSPETHEKFWEVLMRFQQVTSPIMAKGYEDTVFYIYNKLVSLNEVGGEPHVFGRKIPELHRIFQERFASRPLSMNASSTHDTKRGEDVRARVNVLSEMSGEWRDKLKTWSRLNLPHRARVSGVALPDPNDEYLLYQTLLGTYPAEGFHDETYIRRIRDYMIKAVREAKEHTAWIKPDEIYENACLEFIEKILDESLSEEFLSDFRSFARAIAAYGVWNSLSQTFLKMVLPGVPDFYQGQEMLDFSLVDPDNRRPVDYDLRRNVLKDLPDQSDPGTWRTLLKNPHDGRLKLCLIRSVLRARSARADLFEDGEYIPLKVTGRFARSVFAFARRKDGRGAVCVAPRFLRTVADASNAPVGDVWDDTAVSFPGAGPQKWVNALTGTGLDPQKSHPLSSILADCPVGLFLNDG